MSDAKARPLPALDDLSCVLDNPGASKAERRRAVANILAQVSGFLDAVGLMRPEVASASKYANAIWKIQEMMREGKI